MVEVQKLWAFDDFCWPRATVCGDSRGRGSKTVDFLRFLARARDPLRRFAWSRFKNWRSFAIFSMRARPSAEIRVVEVQKLWTFYDFSMRTRPSAEIRVVEVQKLWTFLRFLACAHDPLRRFAWSRLKNWGLFTISAVRARPSAEIVRVEALSLWRRANLS